MILSIHYNEELYQNSQTILILLLPVMINYIGHIFSCFNQLLLMHLIL